MKTSLILTFTFFGLALFCGIDVFSQSRKISIAAASDVKFALDSAINVYAGKEQIIVTYGSSGKLYEQIVSGAPFDIFFSADMSYPEKLFERNIAKSGPELYGTGRIVIWSKVVDPTVLKAKSLLDKKIKRIAIANPQHAPYGKRAEETLKFYGIYDQVKAKLVFGENISQASQYVYSGAAEAGIIALSLALSPPMRRQNGKYFVIPEESHEPLKQAFVLLTSGASSEGMAEFYKFLKTERVRGIFKHYGFNVPETVSK
jgi:molybdate transport system substrate-binding protein